MENQYLHWKEYYFNKWLQQYDDIKDLLSQPDSPIEKVYNYYKKFYYSTIKLLQTYLSNNGSYYNNNVAIIRMAFRYCILPDGDRWMVINDIMEKPRQYKVNDFIENCTGDNFCIFENLHKQFEELAKVDE